MNRSQNYSILLSDVPIENFGIELKSHADNAKVERLTIISGIYRVIPNNVKLRIYTVNENQSLCWVSTQDIIFDRANLKWESKVYIGGANNKGHKFYIIVAVEEDVTDQWVAYYKSVSEKHDSWLPLKYPLSPSILIIKKIEVERI